MRTPFQAQLWELYRTTWVEMLLRIAGLSSLVIVIYSLSAHLRLGDPEVLVIRGVVLMMLLITSLFSAAWLNELDSTRAGFAFRLGFTRPISTLQLAGVPAIFAVAFSVLGYLPVALLAALLFKTEFPIVGPCSLIACMVSCFVASVWSPTSAIGKWVGFALSGAVLIAFMLILTGRSESELPFLMVLGTSEFWKFAWYHHLGSFVIIAFALMIVVVAVGRQRRGDSFGIALPFPSTQLRKFKAPQSGTANVTLSPFRNRWTAQCWYELRQMGPTVLLMAVFVPFMMITFVSVVPSWEHSIRFLVGTLVLCPMVYQLVGAGSVLGLRSKDGSTELSVFDATRAMRTDHLVALKIVLVAACSFLAWLLMAVCAVLQLRFIGDWQTVTKFFDAASGAMGEFSIYWWMTGVASGLLLFISTTSMMLAFGYWMPLHPRKFIAAVAFGFANWLLLAFDLSSDWSLYYLWIAYGYLVPAVIFAVCVFLLNKSLSTGFLSKRFFAGALILWLIHVGTSIVSMIKVFPLITIEIPPYAYAMGFVGLLVPLAATAAAPLALASHRHG